MIFNKIIFLNPQNLVSSKISIKYIPKYTICKICQIPEFCQFDAIRENYTSLIFFVLLLICILRCSGIISCSTEKRNQTSHPNHLCPISRSSSSSGASNSTTNQTVNLSGKFKSNFQHIIEPCFSYIVNHITVV